MQSNDFGMVCSETEGDGGNTIWGKGFPWGIQGLEDGNQPAVEVVQIPNFSVLTTYNL